jgi:hypothetical protein
MWTAGKLRRAEELHAKQIQEEQEQQYVLDDYLESIDRRYRRLHESDEPPAETNKGTGGFTNALHWLTHSEPSSASEEQRKQEDAIYVLGLADLASTRLLQQHNLPIPQSKVNKSIVIDIGFKNDSLDLVNEATAVNEAPERQPSKSTVATPSTSNITRAALILQMLRRVQIQRIFELSKMANQLASDVLRIPLKAIPQALAAALSLLNKTSGSKHSFQLVSVVAATVFTIALSAFRPLSKA